jgi:DNA-binding GntR family transcriptional regulator
MKQGPEFAEKKSVPSDHFAARQLVGGNVETRSLSTQAYELLRLEIVSGRLAAGEKIDVDSIGRHLGISRTPVKDSFNRLAAEGLVEIIPRRGTFVSRFNAEHVLEALQMRLVIEVGAAPLATQLLTESDALELQVIGKKLRALMSGDERDRRRKLAQFSTMDHEFHARIVGLARNSQLNDIYSRLDVHLQVARFYYRRHETDVEATNLEHDLILDSLLKRDAVLLQDALSNHINRVQRFSKVLLDTSEDNTSPQT